MAHESCCPDAAGDDKDYQNCQFDQIILIAEFHGINIVSAKFDSRATNVLTCYFVKNRNQFQQKLSSIADMLSLVLPVSNRISNGISASMPYFILAEFYRPDGSFIVAP